MHERQRVRNAADRVPAFAHNDHEACVGAFTADASVVSQPRLARRCSAFQAPRDS